MKAPPRCEALEPTADDVVFGVSASGRTPYVLGGIAAGRAAGALTIGFACTARIRAGTASDLAIEVATGPEIIAGSTRLKAGSAQKLRAQHDLDLGDGPARAAPTGILMIDVVADNAKLRRRAVRVVVQATGVDDVRAAAALDEAGGRAKVAVVALLRWCLRNTGGGGPCRPQQVTSEFAVSLADARD